MRHGTSLCVCLLIEARVKRFLMLMGFFVLGIFIFLRSIEKTLSLVLLVFVSFLFFFIHLSDSPVVILLFLIATIRLCSWLEHVFTYLEIFIDVIQFGSVERTAYTIQLYNCNVMRKMFQRNLLLALIHTKKRDTH